MTPVVKRTLHWAGSVLAVAGVVFVVLRLHDYGTEIDFSHFDLVVWSIVAGMTLIYALSNVMLALAWWNLLGWFGATTSRGWAIRIYGISQISKYVPGNIFHLAGRQSMGLAAGIPGWPLAKSAVWELGLIFATGGLFSLLTLSLLMPGLSLTASASLFAMAMGTAAVLLWRFTDLPTVRAIGWYAGFLTISGLLFLGLSELLAESHDSEMLPWLPTVGAYVLAWITGFITPGAPAGVGVRELVLLFLLKGLVSETDLLLVIVMARLVTVAGDGLFYIVSMSIPHVQES